jgi:hypothetical protein
VSSYPLTAILIPTLVAIASWFVGSWLAVERDRANKRRDLRVHYLIEAYRRLAVGANRTTPLPGHVRDIESAIEDIQLFGTEAQISAAQRLSQDVAERGGRLADDLLTILRNDLRQELGLETIRSKRIFLRFTDEESKRN